MRQCPKTRHTNSQRKRSHRCDNVQRKSFPKQTSLLQAECHECDKSTSLLHKSTSLLHKSTFILHKSKFLLQSRPNEYDDKTKTFNPILRFHYNSIRRREDFIRILLQFYSSPNEYDEKTKTFKNPDEKFKFKGMSSSERQERLGNMIKLALEGAIALDAKEKAEEKAEAAAAAIVEAK
jgi:hypothetical protein